MAGEFVEYYAPSARAYDGMKEILFRPRSFDKWVLLGVVAWLSELPGGLGGNSAKSVEPLMAIAAHLLPTLGPDWIHGLKIYLVVLMGVMVLAMLWISSTGKFVFLDNLVHDRALISIPWFKFEGLGSSLFGWRLGILLFFVLVIGGLLWPMLSAGPRGGSLGILQPFLLLLAAAGAVAYIYIDTLLEDFVVPLMYRYNCSCTKAWSRFGAIHSGRAGTFAAYFLWKTLLSLLMLVIILAGIVLSGGVGIFILPMALVGTCFLLPFLVFFRLNSLEFLAQFGPNLHLLSIKEPDSAPTPDSAPKPDSEEKSGESPGDGGFPTKWEM